MHTTEMIETVGLRRCPACDGEQLSDDKFCRRCGVSQSLRPITSALESAKYRTRPLTDDEQPYSSFSGSLVGLVTQGVALKTTGLRQNRWVMGTVCVLAAVPLWLLIIMLSPLDTYKAARTISRQV
jgi:hypothetical protein